MDSFNCKAGDNNTVRLNNAAAFINLHLDKIVHLYCGERVLCCDNPVM